MSEFTKTKFKVCIIGDGGAGKTCVLFRLKNNAFNDKDYSPTIFENELIKYDWKGKTVELRLVSSFFCFFFNFQFVTFYCSLWDTAGQVTLHMSAEREKLTGIYTGGLWECKTSGL